MLYGILLSLGIVFSIVSRYLYIESTNNTVDNEFALALCFDAIGAGIIIGSLLSYFGVV